jgi:hypothetical protein
MKKIIFALVALFVISSFSTTAQGQNVNYDKYFTKERLRIDLVFAGDAREQNIFLDALQKEGEWSGSKTNLNDNFNYGEYRYEVYTKTGEKIFSQGFSTLFQEWRTTAESKTTPRAFTGSYRIPFPKEPVTVKFFEREKSNGKFELLYSLNIDPADKMISREKENNFKVTSILNSGDPANKVDILFIAEGYTAAEMAKFRADAAKFAGYLFNIEPYKSRKSDFNIWAVESVSQESGPDIPHQDIWKNSVASSNFFTFRIDRYLTAPDHKKVSQIAANSPCDAMYVIVNTNKYGGGGVYNFYGLSMSDHPTEAAVFVHEFGHSFAGLGDEYYTSDVAYEDFYNLKVEPWEPNLTTLVNFEKKWSNMIDSNTPRPTPNTPEYKNTVGVFEGGGYMAKGIFRPCIDCRMKTNNAPGFCPVCTKAINDMIDFYTK